jgi:hypothetical protein
VHNFSTLIQDLIPFFFKNSILYEIHVLDELVVGSFEPPDARAACDGNIVGILRMEAIR